MGLIVVLPLSYFNPYGGVKSCSNFLDEQHISGRVVIYLIDKKGSPEDWQAGNKTVTA